MIEGLQAIHIDSKPPKFDNESQNPCEFLEAIEKYFITKRVQNKNKLNVLENALEERAKIWFAIQKNDLVDYESFKTRFLEEFYSIPIKVKIESNWLAKRFDPTRGNLQSYFLQQIKEAQYFLPKMESYEVNFIIVQQMPIRVREALVTVDYSSMDKVLQALAQLDATFIDKNNIQKKSYNKSNQSPSQSGNYHGIDNRDRQNVRSSHVRRDLNSVCCCTSSVNGQHYVDVTQCSFPGQNIGYRQNQHLCPKLKLPNFSIPPPTFTSESNQNPSERENSLN